MKDNIDHNDPAKNMCPHTGNGGEPQFQADDSVPNLTTQQGVVISDNQNSLKRDPRGPTLLEDF